MTNTALTPYRFSGHETFPLRQLWPAKAVRFAKACIAQGNRPSFSGEEAMYELGVGKNMVAAIRFWGIATGLLDEKTLSPTPLADLIFGTESSNGLDPYCESQTTAWLLHWNLSKSTDALTSFWFVFNKMNKPSMYRSELADAFIEFAGSVGRKSSQKTLKTDIDVCLRTYIPLLNGRAGKLTEDMVEPLFSGLDLIVADGKDKVLIHRTHRPTLHPALFAYALLQYWETLPNAASALAFTRLSQDIGSPGRVFKLSDEALVNYLDKLNEVTHGELLWTEQAGLRTVVRSQNAINSAAALKQQLLTLAYSE